MDDVYLKQNLNDQNLHFVKHFCFSHSKILVSFQFFKINFREGVAI